MLSVLLECQAPYTEWILSGRKTIETRRYPYPAHLLNKPIWLLETPSGTVGKSALPDVVELASVPGVRILGSIVVCESFRYESREQWDRDETSHCVPSNSGYAWTADGDFYGWVLSSTATLPSPAITHVSRSYRSFFLPVLPVPTVDISDPDSPDVLRAIEDQCKSTGFLRVSWSEFPVDVVARAHDAMRRFFDLDDATKESISKATLVKANDSYCPTGFRSTKGMYNGEGRESWSCTRPDYIPGAAAFDTPFYRLGRKFFAEAPDPQVLWPSEDLVPGFRVALTEYYAAVEALGHVLFRIFARILHLPDADALLNLARHHASSLNVSHLKPSQDRQGSTVVLAPHADITCFTILSHDTADGASGTACLEILNPAHDSTDPHSIAWLGLADVPAQRPSFLVNLGQIMQRWSNGHLKATLHRVVKPIHESTLQQRRQAMVFFQVTNYDAMLASVVPGTPKYTPERMADFTETRFGPVASNMETVQAYSIYNKDVMSPEEFVKLATLHA
ncbi:Aste57867_19441 [Aphanomyces stellatus]|uniref:Aste57867_19441 protein n=1 Tax=Aphanomyces stellatus TaxID=120398 RepID=A0A485LD70_9STRA|nr:hypothetical protein As57867_019377 [Aphanomyces stellatus]VFT96154.1 Aste57867_19441 [Aphanomyces stellatus]